MLLLRSNKLTLRKQDFSKFFENSLIIKRKIKYKKTFPYRELHSPIIYGLLAHTSDVTKSKKILPQEVISEEIKEKDLNYIQHPIEMPDLVCVADLGSWSVIKISYIGPSVVPSWEKIAHETKKLSQI